ncbi:MAG: hypothetical protein HRT35_09220 [Algicola sp.]|nr:hypothetical protein [Algicola sp.]
MNSFDSQQLNLDPNAKDAAIVEVTVRKAPDKFSPHICSCMALSKLKKMLPQKLLTPGFSTRKSYCHPAHLNIKNIYNPLF